MPLRTGGAQAAILGGRMIRQLYKDYRSDLAKIISLPAASTMLFSQSLPCRGGLLPLVAADLCCWHRALCIRVSRTTMLSVTCPACTASNPSLNR